MCKQKTFLFWGGHGFFGLGKTEPPILPETSIEVSTDAFDFARMRQAPPLPLPEGLYNVMGEEPKQERQGMIETPLFAALPTVQFLRGRAKCRRYENKGTCVSKNYMITWRNTHITEVAETSQYASLNRLLSARTIKRRSSRGRSHIPQYDMI